MRPQTGLLADVPPAARFVTYELTPGADPTEVLAALMGLVLPDTTVLGLGLPLIRLLGRAVPGLRPFPALSGVGVSAPSTQGALWARLGGADPGEALHRERALSDALWPVFVRSDGVDGFVYDGGRDLTGYVDGTENPVDDAAFAAAICSDPPGSSFVAVQQWVHDLDTFDGFAGAEQDDMIGRRRSDDVELADAPASAHVKRTAQEDFAPAAFVVRRSMPWSDGEHSGLVFVAFGHSLDAFEAQLRRMLGLDDGVVDALFRFTRPVTGGYYWCPAVSAGRLVLPV